MTGDYLWMSTMSGYDRPSCQRPCLWCTALAWQTSQNGAEVEKSGCTQDGSPCFCRPRTARHATRITEIHRDGDNKSRPTPLLPHRYASIVRSPLMVFSPAEIAPMVLHITLEITARLPSLAVETVVAEMGEAGAGEMCAALSSLRREKAGEVPAPYFGGVFDGAECHRITR